MNFLVFTMTISLCSVSFAEFNVGLAAGWFSDQNAVSSGAKAENYVYDLELGAQINQSHKIFLVADYVVTSSSANLTATTSVSFETHNPMVGLKQYYFNKDILAVSLTGTSIATGRYIITNSIAEDVKGTAFLAKVIVQPEISSRLRLTFSLNYFLASYEEVKSSQNSGATLPSFSRSFMTPTIGLLFKF